MKVVIGSSQDNGRAYADDGDPADGGPDSQSGFNAMAFDYSSTAEEIGVPSFRFSWFKVRAHAETGLKPTSIAQARALIVRTTEFEVDTSWYNWFGGSHVTFTVIVKVEVSFVIPEGPASFDLLVALGPARVRHHYEVKRNPTDADKIDLYRDGALVQTFTLSGIFNETFSATADLPKGQYAFVVEGKADARADGVADIEGLIDVEVRY